MHEEKMRPLGASPLACRPIQRVITFRNSASTSDERLAALMLHLQTPGEDCSRFPDYDPAPRRAALAAHSLAGCAYYSKFRGGSAVNPSGRPRPVIIISGLQGAGAGRVRRVRHARRRNLCYNLPAFPVSRRAVAKASAEQRRNRPWAR